MIVRARLARGFTIVELLVVIIIIGIVASLAFVGFSGAQTQARQTKIKNDLAEMRKAIDTARHTQGNESLEKITGQSVVAGPCVSKPDGTDLAKLSRSDPCWTNYISAMKSIEQASGVKGLSDMVDPWGRPYFIDPNETDIYATQGYCEKDYIQAYTYPFKSGWAGMEGTTLFFSNSHTSCMNT